MHQTASTILYINRHYHKDFTSAGIRARRFVQAVRSAGYAVIVLTEGQAAAFAQAESDLWVGAIGPEGKLPKEVQDCDARWPWWEVLPGPDPAEAFHRSLYRFCHWLLDRHQIDMIYVSGPPFALFVIGRRCGEEFQVPVVLEMRDAWFKGVLWPYENVVRRELARFCEWECLEDAAKIVVVTRAHRLLLLHEYPTLKEEDVVYIPHSYDADLQHTEEPDSLPEEIRPDHFTLAYVGQVHGADQTETESYLTGLRRLQRGLRRVVLGANFCEKLRFDWMSPLHLLQAVCRAGDVEPDLLRRLRLVFVGSRVTQLDRWAVDLGLQTNVLQMGTMPPDKAQLYIDRADVLITSLYGIEGEKYHWCVPNKTYSYIGAGKPVLALFPPGEARDIVLDSGVGFVTPPEDIDGIAAVLLNLFKQFCAGGIHVQPDWDYIRQFEYSRQQERFVELVRSIISP